MTARPQDSGLDEARARSLLAMSARAAAAVRAQPGRADALTTIVQAAQESIPGVAAASISWGYGRDRFRTPAATDRAADRADRLQYDIGTGPCVEAIRTSGVVLSPDLADDRRWPELGARIAHETGLRSALSIQIVMEEEHAAGLNLYGNAVAAFDRHTVDVLPVFTAQAASALEAVAARQKAENLEKALLTSREIGMALGILMSSMKIRSEEAFDILRIASQARHRKLVDLARDVVETGMLDLGPS